MKWKWSAWEGGGKRQGEGDGEGSGRWIAW